MAKRPSTPADLREAVERTVQATLGSAERQRERTQGALDDLAGTVDQVRKGAEAGIARGRKAVAGAIESGRPATYEDIRDLQAELRRISRRLDAIEERLPAKRRSSGGARPSAGPRGRPRALVTRARASRSAAGGGRRPGAWSNARELSDQGRSADETPCVSSILHRLTFPPRSVRSKAMSRMLILLAATGGISGPRRRSGGAR